MAREEYINTLELDNAELKKENQELKKQLENKYEKVGTLTNEILYEENAKLVNQQKEFIKYLEAEIEKQRKKSKTLTAFIRNVVPLQQCLQKYKEIIRTKNDNSV